MEIDHHGPQFESVIMRREIALFRNEHRSESLQTRRLQARADRSGRSAGGGLVDDDQRRRRLVHQPRDAIQRRALIVRRDAADAPGPQIVSDRSQKTGPVAEHHGRESPVARHAPLLVDGERQIEIETAALSGIALDEDPAAHQLDQIVRYRHAQAGAAHPAGVGIIHLGEAVEDRGDLVLRDTDAAVDDLETQLDRSRPGVERIDAYLDEPLLGELDSIAHQIHQNLLQTQLITDQVEGDLRCDVGAKTYAFSLRHRPVGLADDGDHGVQIEGPFLDRQAARLDFGKVEDVVEDAQQMLGRLLDGADLPQGLAAVVFGEHQLAHADDPRERGPDLVTHVGEESRLGLVGRQRLLLGDDQLAQQVGDEDRNHHIGDQQGVAEKGVRQPELRGADDEEKSDIRQQGRRVEVVNAEAHAIADRDQHHDGIERRAVLSQTVEAVEDNGVVADQRDHPAHRRRFPVQRETDEDQQGEERIPGGSDQRQRVGPGEFGHQQLQHVDIGGEEQDEDDPDDSLFELLLGLGAQTAHEFAHAQGFQNRG